MPWVCARRCCCRACPSERPSYDGGWGPPRPRSPRRGPRSRRRGSRGTPPPTRTRLCQRGHGHQSVPGMSGRRLDQHGFRRRRKGVTPSSRDRPATAIDARVRPPPPRPEHPQAGGQRPRASPRPSVGDRRIAARRPFRIWRRRELGDRRRRSRHRAGQADRPRRPFGCRQEHTRRPAGPLRRPRCGPDRSGWGGQPFAAPARRAFTGRARRAGRLPLLDDHP
jgi:hypothetical protein